MLTFATLYWTIWMKDLSPACFFWTWLKHLTPLTISDSSSNSTRLGFPVTQSSGLSHTSKTVAKLPLLEMFILLVSRYLLVSHKEASSDLCCFLFTLMIYHHAYVNVIYVSAKDAATLESRLSIDLQSISKWFFDNLLTLNENKCKFVLFGSSQKLKSFQNFSLCINDYNLERTDSFKYLGVTISQNMTWQDHISWIVNKVNQHLGVLRRVRQMLPLQSRLTLYNSLVLPLFDYGDTVWGKKYNFTLMENLQILQNKAAKIILDHRPHSSASKALDSLGWKTLHLRRRFHRCTTIFKCLNGFIDFNFNFVRTQFTITTRVPETIFTYLV